MIKLPGSHPFSPALQPRSGPKGLGTGMPPIAAPQPSPGLAPRPFEGGMPQPAPGTSLGQPGIPWKGQPGYVPRPANPGMYGGPHQMPTNYGPSISAQNPRAPNTSPFAVDPSQAVGQGANAPVQQPPMGAPQPVPMPRMMRPRMMAGALRGDIR